MDSIKFNNETKGVCMKYLSLKYLLSLLCGIIIGWLIDITTPLFWYLILEILSITVAIVEVVGMWGFRSRWYDYRLSLHLNYTGVLVCGLTGVLIGRGKIGEMFIFIGNLIS